MDLPINQPMTLLTLQERTVNLNNLSKYNSPLIYGIFNSNKGYWCIACKKSSTLLISNTNHFPHSPNCVNNIMPSDLGNRSVTKADPPDQGATNKAHSLPQINWQEEDMPMPEGAGITTIDSSHSTAPLPTEQGVIDSNQHESLKVNTDCDYGMCPICHEDFLHEKVDLEDTYDTSKYTILTDCKHKFHTVCLKNWLSQTEYESTCPECRNLLAKLNRVEMEKRTDTSRRGVLTGLDLIRRLEHQYALSQIAPIHILLYQAILYPHRYTSELKEATSILSRTALKNHLEDNNKLTPDHSNLLYEIFSSAKKAKIIGLEDDLALLAGIDFEYSMNTIDPSNSNLLGNMSRRTALHSKEQLSSDAVEDIKLIFITAKKKRAKINDKDLSRMASLWLQYKMNTRDYNPEYGFVGMTPREALDSSQQPSKEAVDYIYAMFIKARKKGAKIEPADLSKIASLWFQYEMNTQDYNPEHGFVGMTPREALDSSQQLSREAIHAIKEIFNEAQTDGSIIDAADLTRMASLWFQYEMNTLDYLPEHGLGGITPREALDSNQQLSREAIHFIKAIFINAEDGKVEVDKKDSDRMADLWSEYERRS